MTAINFDICQICYLTSVKSVFTSVSCQTGTKSNKRQLTDLKFDKCLKCTKSKNSTKSQNVSNK